MFQKSLLLYCVVMISFALSCAPSGDEPAEEGVGPISSALPPGPDAGPSGPEVTPTPPDDTSQLPQLLANSTVTTLAIGAEAQITVSGGTPPYVYTVASGGGAIDNAGLYTAPFYVGAEVVRVTDDAGVVSEAPIDVVQRERIAAGGGESGEGFNCALLDDNSVKCWGWNQYGQLGLGNTSNKGGRTGEMGDSLLSVDLGKNHTAKAVTVGAFHACALLDDNSVKCWGHNGQGQLGLGNTEQKGDGSVNGKMGDALPRVDLGTDATGRPFTAKTIAAGGRFTCAILEDNSVKCWGQNHRGQLGQGDQVQRGDDANEMGDALLRVDLGKEYPTGRPLTAKALAAGGWHACALLDDDSVKCWGNNEYGALGRGDKSVYGYCTQWYWTICLNRADYPNNVGDAAGEMGDNLPTIDLGAGRTAKAITAGNYYNCALLDDNSVKCWGDNRYGALGLEDGNGRGDAPNEMGDALLRVNLGTDVATGRFLTAKAVSAGRYHHTCALLDDNSVKCWGGNYLGQLGQGDTNHRGDAPNEMGSALLRVNLGMDVTTGRFLTAKAIVVGGDHSCALLDNRELKCWGRNGTGELGLGDVNARGDTPNPSEMGDNLLPVDLGTNRSVHR